MCIECMYCFNAYIFTYYFQCIYKCMANLCKPAYIVNALPELRFSSSETETYHFRKQWTTTGSCGVPSFCPGTTTAWECIRNSPWKGVRQWNKIPFSGSGTLCFYCLQALLQIQEWRCGTTGSCWRAYLPLYLTLPWIWNESLFSLKTWSPRLVPLRGCSRETCMNATLWFISALPASVQNGVQHQKDSLGPRAIRTS